MTFHSIVVRLVLRDGQVAVRDVWWQDRGQSQENQGEGKGNPEHNGSWKS